MIAIIDYDMGNLKSVARGLEVVGAQVRVTRQIGEIESADKIVLPGVGAFSKCMENLKAYGLVEIIKQEIARGKNFLGICLGLQLLFEESEEFGNSRGLGILQGKVKRFQFKQAVFKVPHMGWNTAVPQITSPILAGIDPASMFYFVHSYYVEPQDKSITTTETKYGGISFSSSITKDNIFACQFHPEKSQKAGLQLLENFCKL